MQTDEDYLNSVAELLKEARLGCTRLAVNPDDDHAILCSIDEKLRVALLLLEKLRTAKHPSVGTVTRSSWSGRITGGY